MDNLAEKLNANIPDTKLSHKNPFKRCLTPENRCSFLNADGKPCGTIKQKGKDTCIFHDAEWQANKKKAATRSSPKKKMSLEECDQVPMLELILSHLIGIVERIDPKIAKSMLESLDKLQIETVKSKEKTESDLDHLLFTLAFLRDDINRPEFYAKVREGYNEVLSDVGYDRRFKVLQKLDKMSYPYVYPEK